MTQDATFSELRLGEEDTLGTPPTGSNYPLVVMSADIKRELTRKRPNVWTGSRRVRPQRVVAGKGSVPIKAPLIYYQSLALYQGLMLNTAATQVIVTDDDISFDTSDKQILRVTNGLDVFLKGRMVHVRGASVAANNGWKGPIMTSAAGALTLPAGQVVDEAAGASITLDVIEIIDNPTPDIDDDRSFSAQWKATVLGYYRRMSGARLDVVTWDFNNEDFISETFDLKGRQPVKDTAVMGSGDVSGWPKATDPFGTNEDLKQIYIGNSSLGARVLCFSTLQIAMRNNRIDKLALASGIGGPLDRIPGPFEVEFTGESYLDDDTIALLDAIDDEESLFAFATAEDLAGNGMCWLAPAGRADADPMPGEAGSLIKFGGFKYQAHDAAKDSASDFYASGSGPGFQGGLFFSPKP